MALGPDDLPPTADVAAFSREVRAARRRLEQLASGPPALAADRPGELLPVTSEHLWKTQEELQVAEEELRQQSDALFAANIALDVERQRYEELFQEAPDAYVVTDVRGVIIEANRAAATLFGVAPAGLPGKPITVFVPMEMRSAFRAQLNAICGGDVTRQQWECDLESRGGEPVPVAVSATLSRTPDSRSRTRTVRWLIRDLTTLMAAEARATSAGREVEVRVSARTAELEGIGRTKESLLAREREKRLEAERLQRRHAELLHVLGHELRTPVAAAQGYAELLERGIRGELTAAQREDVERISRCHGYLLHVLDSVLSHTRLENGEIDVEIAAVPVDETLAGIRQYFEPQLIEADIAFGYTPGDPSVSVRADRGLIHQILLNLVGNAIRFTPRGGRIQLFWTADDDQVEMRVADTGCGISREDIERIFEPFVQLKRGTHASDSGAGLGLAISRRLAAAMGGELKATSVVGEGSTFTLALPRSSEAVSA